MYYVFHLRIFMILIRPAKSGSAKDQDHKEREHKLVGAQSSESSVCILDGWIKKAEDFPKSLSTSISQILQETRLLHDYLGETK